MHCEPGIEGQTAYKGPIAPVVHQLVGGQDVDHAAAVGGGAHQVGQFQRIALGRNTLAWVPGTDVGDLAKQQAMLDYIATDGCRMEFLRRQLDLPAGDIAQHVREACGDDVIDRAALETIAEQIEAIGDDLVQRAMAESGLPPHLLELELTESILMREVNEAILGRLLDPANFRRQVEASGTVIPTDRFRTGSHRPARLYRYNQDVELADRGPLPSSIDHSRHAREAQ